MVRVVAITILFLFAFNSFLNAQCAQGNISISTQVALDDYISTYTDSCTIQAGNLTISGNEITDISGLSFLTQVAGSLTVQNMNGLTSLSGLENINIINGSLTINNLDAITDLTGLNTNGIIVSNNVDIRNCAIIENVDGLSGITNIPNGFLRFSSNPLLQNIDGVQNIENISSSVNINSNASLSDCSVLCSFLENNIVANNSYSVSGNITQCSSLDEVKINCQLDPCFSENLTFRTQVEVDSYVANYSGCTIHDGRLTITGNNITDISGLSFLTEIRGNVAITSSNSLLSLAGLENIQEIDGSFTISNVDLITDIDDLSPSLDIATSISIENCDLLQNLDGFSSLTRINSNLSIYNNPALSDISSLSNLVTVNNNFGITYCHSLTNLSGLENLKTVGSLTVSYNNGLLDVNALANLQTAVNLTVRNNQSLTDCDGLCKILNSNTGPSNPSIVNNPSECSSVSNVEILCETNACFDGDVFLSSQSDVDLYVSTFETSCTSHNGDITISGNTITDLSGLSFLTEINGHLDIINCAALDTLAGLENIINIEGYLRLYNNNLITDLTGINSNGLTIGSYVNIEYMGLITEIDELLGITDVPGNLIIGYNNSLLNVNGIANITSIGGSLVIRNNANLDDCDPVCNLINADAISGSITIVNNLSTCSTFNEVNILCDDASCYVGNLTLRNQDEVDAYVAQYSGCSVHDGDLSLTSNLITDISGLSFLTEITGRLTISYTNTITALDGFSNLEKIGGQFYLLYVDNLFNVDDLNGSNLQFCNNIIIERCDDLENLDGFAGLQQLDGSIVIQYNSSLQNLNGFSDLLLIDGSLTVRFNTVLQDCNSLCQLLQSGGVRGSTLISNNPSMCSSQADITATCTASACNIGDQIISTQQELIDFTTTYASCDSLFGSLEITGTVSDLSLLSSISFISGNLEISNNSVLSSLTGFGSLEVLSSLFLSSNSALTSIDGIQSIQVNKDITISYHTLLEDLDELSYITTIGRNLTVRNNSLIDNLNGLQNVQLIQNNLSIFNNPLLSDCSGICTIVNNDAIGGNKNIYGNETGCDTYQEVILRCVVPGTCPSVDIIINSQAELDTFITAFQTCPIFEGSLSLNGTSITDISGLNFLTEIQGSLTLENLDQITSFDALENITSIGGNLNIRRNNLLTSFDSWTLSNLGGDLDVFSNTLLDNLTGLSSVTEMEFVTIRNNPELVSLTGLEALVTVNRRISIYSNNKLANLSGLENLDFIGENIQVYSNPTLTDCSVLCTILENANYGFEPNIYANPSECSSAAEIRFLCNDECPDGNVYFTSQAEIDAFVNNGTVCDSIFGYLRIEGSTITDLSGLSNISYVASYLYVNNCSQLSSLNGLEGITEIGGSLDVRNCDLLTDIDELSTIASVPGSVTIRDNSSLTSLAGINHLTEIFNSLTIYNNDALIDLSDLNLLESVNGSLLIAYNQLLENLDGLATLESVQSNLEIYYNPNLEDCGGICNIINDDGVNGTLNIFENPMGCSSAYELSILCNPVCPEGNLTFINQNEVDIFVSVLTGCDTIFGDLTISGSNAITDISGLSDITHVTGNLNIDRTYNLADLTGLEGITKIGGRLRIVNTRGLTDISALGSLTQIGTDITIISNRDIETLSGLPEFTAINGSLRIQDNTNLSDISVFSDVSTIGGFLYIRSNPALESLAGFTGLNFIGNYLNISYNTSLTDCSGICNVINNGNYGSSVSIFNNPSACSSFTEISTLCAVSECPTGNVVLASQIDVDAFTSAFSSCDSIPGSLTISGNSTMTDISGLSFITHISGNLIVQNLQNITDLSGFDNLQSVNGYVRIYNCDMLTSIAQLSQLTEIGGALNITYNDVLTNVNGLTSLSSVGGNLDIYNNPMLDDCSGFCDLINNNQVAGNLNIYNNPSECSSGTEVAALCNTDDCPSGDITLRTQIEVNAFVSAYSNCDSLPGSLIINGSNAINDISTLSFISYIAGDLEITNTVLLTTLNGLQNLTGIGGSLFINNVTQLEQLDALAALETIGGQLYIYNNDDLLQVNGLNQLTSVGSNLTVRFNDALTDCDGLCALVSEGTIGGSILIASNPSSCSSLTEVTTLCTTEECPSGDVTLSTQVEVDAFVTIFNNCDSIPGNLTITGSNSITDLSGLQFVTYVTGNLNIQSNYNITDLSGFENLTGVGGDFRLQNNLILNDIAELSQLESIGGLFYLYNNDSLTMLTGLEQLTSIGSSLTISQNGSLADCSVICDLLENGGTSGNINISGNPALCSSLSEVQSLCSYGSMVSTIFINSLADTIQEGDVLDFELAVDFAPSEDLTINLSSNNPTEVPLPQTVVIPAGQLSVPVSITLPDDANREENDIVSITAGAQYLQSASESFLLSDDNDIPSFEFEIFQDTVSEAAGFYAAEAVIRRLVDDGSVLNVALSADVADLIILPDGVSLSPTEQEKTFFIGTLDNTQVDGYKNVEITASYFIPSCNCTAASTSNGVVPVDFVVSDDDGPSLSLTVDLLSLQEDQAEAGILTITRNTDTSLDLEVFLSVDDDTELSLPVSVIIPAGSNSVDVSMTTLGDPISDGNQQVTINASASGFTPGTIWVIVTDINKPDFTIADVVVPLTEVPSSDNMEFKVFVTNVGYASAPSGAILTGYLSKNEILDDDDFKIGDYVLDVPLAVGDTLEIPNLGTTPFQPRDYFLLFRINSDDALTELLFLNNISDPISISVLPDYLGSAIVDEDLYLRGSQIPVYGSSFKENGTLVPNAELEVYITVDGVRRELNVTTDENGNYETIFEPLPYEAGHYTVGASFPEQASTDIDDEFDIVGVRINNNGYAVWQLLLNDPLNGVINVTNQSGTALTNVTLDPAFLPSGAAINIDPIPTLDAYATVAVPYEVTGTEVTTIQDFVEIPMIVNSDEISNIQEFTGYYFCQAQQAYLRSEISSINTTMSKDNSRIFEFMIFNDGMGETQDIEVGVPAVSWLKLVSPAVMPSLLPGDTSIVTLELIPTDDLPLNTPGSGNIVVNATNGNNLNIPFIIEKVSDETGGVIVDVIDQYTYFTEEAPHVAGASVKITHYFTGEVFAEGITDADGLFDASGIPEGTHRIVIQAEDHFGYDGLIVINPGVVREETIFIEYQTISFSWDVVPTTVEDEYQIDLIIEFETNVPAPVVLMEMVDTMPQLFGDETFPFFITLTNVGLITANEVELRLPQDDPEYIFMTNYEPQDLLAQQAIQVPVEMKRRDAGNLIAEDDKDGYNRLAEFLNINGPGVKSGGNCRDYAGTVYWYECGDNGLYQQGAELFSYSGRSCSDSGTSTPTIGGPGYVGSPSSPGGGCSNCETGSSVPTTSVDCKCNDCLKNLALAGANCAPGPIGALGGAALCLVKGGSCNPFSPPNCVDGLLQAAALCGCTVCDCVADVLDVDIKKKSAEVDVEAVFDKIGGLAAGGFTKHEHDHKNNEPEFSSLLLQPMDDLAVGHFIDKIEDYIIIELFGDISADENFMDFLPLIVSYVSDTLQIDNDQRQYVLAEMANFDMPPSDINTFIDRWNDTVLAWNGGVYAPDGTYPVIANKLLLDSLDMILAEGATYVQNRGFASPLDMVENAVGEVVRLTSVSDDPNENTAFNPVCASVTINISQTLTMVREAFEGTLTVFNGHPTDALQNLSLNLEILDENGVVSNDLFEIETTEVNTLSAIDGTGTLSAEESGFAKVLFIPESGAAPTAPRFYSFGGTISYLDPFSNLMVTLPLIPVTLQVNPNPDLFLHYFMQRDIYSDDPLTGPIEPTIPADLAVMIENNGYGLAQQVVIESAQPEIVDNDKGLAINFNLIGSNLQGEPFTLGLNTIDFGNIEPFKTKIGQWYFTSSLLGHFTNYETNVVHLDSRGNPDLSLVSGAELHELLHTITVYGDADDGINDFLVNDIFDTEDNPDAIYLSQGNLVYDVFPAVEGVFSGNILAAGNTTQLSVDPLGIGWNYIKLDDPGNGNFEIVSVTRNEDGQEIPLTNAWLSYVTIPDGGAPNYEDKFHFADDFAAFAQQTYTVVWSPLDPNPPMVVSIDGAPTSVTSDQVTSLIVTFSEEIIDSTFTIDDLELKFQGGTNIIDGSVNITKLDSVTYEVDLASLTTGNGFYVFIVQAADVEDLTGTTGSVGEQVSWTQFLSVPAIQQYIGIPDDYIASAFDTVQVLFNVPLDLTTFTIDDVSITLDGVVQTGTLSIDPVDDSNRLFKISGLGSFLTSDAAYELNIDLQTILAEDQTSGLSVQSVPLILDTEPVVVTNLVRSNEGGIDEQHYTKMTINFSEDIQAFDSTAISLSYNGTPQTIFAENIQSVSDNWYEIIFSTGLTYPDGAYEFSIDMTKVLDYADNPGIGSESQAWMVDRNAELSISNVNVDPDLGFSATDGVTSQLDLNVMFDINEEARNIFIYQNDNGVLTELATLVSATAGSYSIPVVFGTGGQTTVEIWMEDLMGNPVMVERELYLDESILSAAWDMMPDQELTVHPNSILLNFNADVVDLTGNVAGLLMISKDNSVLSSDDLVLTKVSADQYELTGLDLISDLPGTYTVSADISLFTKYSSGITGTDLSIVSWSIVDTNQIPISDAGDDDTVVFPVIYTLDGSGSMDPDNDPLIYTWYPPSNVIISDSSAINPTFDLGMLQNNEVYTFLLEVSDGSESSTDQVRITTAFEVAESILLQAPLMEYCESDSINVQWQAPASITDVTISLSNNGGNSFTIPLGNNVDAGLGSQLYALEDLEGDAFVLRVEDAADNMNFVISEVFAIHATDSTYVESLTCDLELVGETYETYANEDGCDSLVVTNTLYDELNCNIGDLDCEIIEVKHVSCNGSADGSISVLIEPDGALTYEISPNVGINNQDGSFTNLPPGNYEIAVSNEFEAMVICDEVVIIELDELSCILVADCLEAVLTTEDWSSTNQMSHQASLSNQIGVDIAVANQANSIFFITNPSENLTNANAAWFSEDVAGAPAARFYFKWDLAYESQDTPLDNSDDQDTVVITISFDQPVTDPVLHIDRLGGATTTGKSNSTNWKLLSNGSLLKMSGTDNLIVNGDSFHRQILDSGVLLNPEANSNIYYGSAAGSVKVVTGSPVSSISFELTGLGYEGTGGDQFELLISASECVEDPEGALGTRMVDVLDGSIQIIGVGGTGVYTFELSPNLGINQGNGFFTDLPVGDYTVTISDSNMCTTECLTFSVVGDVNTFICDDSIATSDVDVCLDDNITLYSNPVSGEFQIKGTLEDYDILILNGDGSMLENLNTNDNYKSIDINSMPNGLYMISIQHKSNGQIHLEKIVKY